VVASDGKGGLIRILMPTNPTVEEVTGGLPEGISLLGLWSYGNSLWSVDSYNISLITFLDTMINAPKLESPADNENGINSEIR
jgi:hypothetical protein